MILPNNGKVVIIDDKLEEVEDLMSALSTEKVPYVHFKEEDGKDLPGEPIDNVRLIFLDLKLVEDSIREEKNIIGPIASRLKKILSTSNGPYILLYWSNKEDEYRAILEEEFENALKDYKPFIMLSMTKGKSIEDIKTELHEKYEQFQSLKAFLLWESFINKSAGEISNDFTAFYSKDSDWDKNLKGVIYRLAKAMNEGNIGALSNEQKLLTAFLNINNAFIDTVEKNLKNNYTIDIGDINDNNIDVAVSSQINTKLHIIKEDEINILQSGNLYFVANTNNDIEKIIEDNVKETKREEIKSSSPQLVELDVTPNCDYAQSNTVYVRLLPGIMVKGDFKKNFKEFGYNYRLCPIMNIEGERKYLLFDYRFFKSYLKNDIENRSPKPKYRIRNNLLADIQASLSKHIYRPGFISILHD